MAQQGPGSHVPKFVSQQGLGYEKPLNEKQLSKKKKKEDEKYVKRLRTPGRVVLTCY